MYKPLFPYDEDQILISSNRVSINSKTDSIFFFSSKIISLSSNEGIHINTDNKVVINSSNIYLGLNAVEPLVKGNQLTNFHVRLINDLKNVGEQLSDAVDSNNNPLPSVQTAGNILIKSSRRLNKLIKSINSEVNYTK